MSLLFDGILQPWIDDCREVNARLTRVYCALRIAQRNAVNNAETAIRHNNPRNFVHNRMKFQDIQRLIRREFADYDQEAREANDVAVFPEWPSEEYYVLYDEQPQYIDADAVDIPF